MRSSVSPSSSTWASSALETRSWLLQVVIRIKSYQNFWQLMIAIITSSPTVTSLVKRRKCMFWKYQEKREMPSNQCTWPDKRNEITSMLWCLWFPNLTSFHGRELAERETELQESASTKRKSCSWAWRQARRRTQQSGPNLAYWWPWRDMMHLSGRM